MMSRQLALSVEHPTGRTSVVYVCGVLDRSTTPRLARLLDAQLDWCLARSREAGDEEAHLIVDLGGVSVFGADGIAVLRSAHHLAAEARVVMAMTGLSARAGLLPGRADTALSRFDDFPDVRAALAALSGRADGHPPDRSAALGADSAAGAALPAPRPAADAGPSNSRVGATAVRAVASV